VRAAKPDSETLINSITPNANTSATSSSHGCQGRGVVRDQRFSGMTTVIMPNRSLLATAFAVVVAVVTLGTGVAVADVQARGPRLGVDPGG
jgi:hypothetical protein